MRLSGIFASRKGPTVSLWHRFRRPPWGGGNQFMIALRGALSGQGVRVRENFATGRVDGHVVHSVWFDADQLRGSISRYGGPPIIHRLDGIMSMYRSDGSGSEQDQRGFTLNRELASATVVQSRWILERMAERGYHPVNPVVIPNAADPSIFHPRRNGPNLANRKVRLISTAWSTNVNKGADLYKWLEDRLDWDRFDYTFVGRSPVAFDRIKHVPSLPSKKLAGLLRQHDVFITASRKEACSNALIEALSCSLPAVYIDDASHAELVGQGGLPFSQPEEVLPQLELLVRDYDRYRAAVRAPRIEDVAQRYLALITGEATADGG